MRPVKLPVSLSVFYRALVVVWLLVLSGLVFSTLGTTAQMQAEMSESGQERRVLFLENTVAELAGQLAALQARPWVHPDQLMDAQRELNGRIRTVNDNLAGLARQSELQALQAQLQQLQFDMQALQALQAAPVVKLTAPADATPPRRGNASAARVEGTNATPPFKVLGVELRGGEHLLSILPTGKASVASVVLLHVGQPIGAWRLEAIEAHHAVFKVGERTRRIAIP